MKKDSIPWIPKLCYGVGHFMNDLCAAMWFAYILIFYDSVLQFNDMYAGYIMLVGQIADGLSTPVVGILADKENKIPLCARYGRRKVFHLIGTILVIISFPFIFNKCLGCEDSSEGTRFAYHAVFVIIFQFAWACVQVSHLALIPVLANRKTQRTELNSIRYAFMVLANMLVFIITFIYLGVGAFREDDDSTSSTEAPTTPMTTLISLFEEKETGDSSGNIGPQHLEEFRNVALTCIGIGTVFSIIFHVGTREPQMVKVCEGTDKQNNNGKSTVMRKRDWFKMRTFYQVAAMYTVTRLYVNLYTTYVTQFVDKTLSMEIIFVAVVPMIMNFSSFLGSFIMKPVNRILGRKRTFSVGCCVGIVACLWIGVSDPDQMKEWGIYPVAVLLGIGGSVLLITSLSITADLIGDNSEGGAFVYGFMSLLDKISNGLVILIIQNSANETRSYYRNVLAFACGAPCIMGILITLTLYKSRIGNAPQCTLDSEVFENDDEDTDSVDSVKTIDGCKKSIEDGDLPNGHVGSDNPAFAGDENTSDSIRF